MLRRCDLGPPTVDIADASSNLTDGFDACPPSCDGVYEERGPTPRADVSGERSFGVCGKDELVVAEPDDADDRSRDTDCKDGEGRADEAVTSVSDDGAVELTVRDWRIVAVVGFETDRGAWYGNRCGEGGEAAVPT